MHLNNVFLLYWGTIITVANGAPMSSRKRQSITSDVYNQPMSIISDYSSALGSVQPQPNSYGGNITETSTVMDKIQSATQSATQSISNASYRPVEIPSGPGPVIPQSMPPLITSTVPAARVRRLFPSIAEIR